LAEAALQGSKPTRYAQPHIHNLRFVIATASRHKLLISKLLTWLPTRKGEEVVVVAVVVEREEEMNEFTQELN
jgi:hypothetical protein